MTNSIRFPSATRYQTSDAFFDGIYKWMTRVVGAELYRHFKTGEVLPEAEELIEWLDKQGWAKIKKYVADYQDKAGRGEWSGEQYQRQLERAVSFCLKNYDPERIHNRAHKGGKVGAARKPSYSLAAFRALPEGLTVAQQRVALGCKSDATVYALRKKNKKYDAVLAGEFDTATAMTSVSIGDHADPMLDGDFDSAFRG